MVHNDHLLQSLCRDQETLLQAQSILRLAQKKTGPGSGYELGSHTPGLPAICAHIASQRLNNTDVTRKNAQVASCLKASDFEKAFHIVQAAIGGSRKKSSSSETYEALIRTYNLSADRERLSEWIRPVERALLQSNNRLTLDVLGMKSAIFFWVYNVIKGKTITTPQAFSEENEIPLKHFKKLVDQISSICSSLKTRMQADTKPKHTSPVKSATTPRKSPTKPPLRALPSKDSPQKRKLVEPQPANNELTSDVDMLDTVTYETPTKKRRTESPMKSVQRISPRKPTPPPIASSSRTTLDTGDGDIVLQPITSSPRKAAVDPSTPRRIGNKSGRHVAATMDTDIPADPPSSDESDVDELPPPRRFRPVYLDHKQWYSRDPRLNRIWKQAEKHKRKLIELHGHPFEQYRP